jgi:peptidoglycan/LPS O-acetylase OafA/YrhL
VNERRRTQGLDGMRGVAALSVFCNHVYLYHLHDAWPSDRGWAAAFGREARLGLICFFVLTGYLLYARFVRAQLRGQPPAIYEYLSRRFVRIIPAYYLSLAGAYLLFDGAPSAPGFGNDTLADAPIHLLFLQDYFPSTINRLNSVTWTLGIEMTFYIFLPLLAWLIWRLRLPSRILLAIPVVLFASGYVYNLEVSHLHGSIIWQTALPSYLPYFAVGMFVATIVERQQLAQRRTVFSPRASWLGLLAGLVGVFGNGAWEYFTHFNQQSHAWWIWNSIVRDTPSAVGFGLILSVVVFGSGWAQRWSEARWLVGFGMISYSFYLWHLMIIQTLRRYSIAPHFWEMALIAGPAALIIAIGSWFGIEEPLLRQSHKPQRRAAAIMQEPAVPLTPPPAPAIFALDDRMTIASDPLGEYILPGTRPPTTAPVTYHLPDDH